MPRAAELNPSETVAMSIPTTVPSSGDNVDHLMERFKNDTRLIEVLRNVSEETEESPTRRQLPSTTKTASEKYSNSSAIGSVLSELNTELTSAEMDSVRAYVGGYEDLLELQRNLEGADSLLESVETVLLSFQQSLSGVSTKISDLQNLTLEMKVKLQNRNSSSELLSTFVDQILLTPQLVKHICNDPLDQQYMAHLDTLEKKLVHASQPGNRMHPSCVVSAAALEKLKSKAVLRIRDFLAEQIQELKRPMTNIQILQRNVLLKYKQFNRFLVEHHPRVAHEIRQLYVQTLSGIYYSQFRTYFYSLQNAVATNVATKSDLLGTLDQGGYSRGRVNSSTRYLVGNLLGFGGQPEQALLCQRGNVFSIGDRADILGHLDADPIIRHTLVSDASKKFNEEQIFRSHQKLLLDTASSEFLFVIDFFADKESCATTAEGSSSLPGTPHAVFKGVFQRTLNFLAQSIAQSMVAQSYDSVGLLIMARINRHNMLTMSRRRIGCLDTYLDKLSTIIWARLMTVLSAHTQSLHSANAKALMDIPANCRTHPHYITRRFAELLCSLQIISNKSVALAAVGAESLHPSILQLMSAMEQLITRMAQQLSEESEVDRVVFRINSWHLVLQLHTEHELTNDITFRFAKLLRDQTGAYVENQLQSNFGELMDFIRQAELAVESEKGKIGGGGGEEHESVSFRRKIDVEKMESLVRHFAAEWKNILQALRQAALDHFTDFTAGMEILKQILTQLLLYCTRLQKIVLRAYPADRPQPAWIAELVPSNEILIEIRKQKYQF